MAIAISRHEAESALRVSQERLQLALEGSGDGLWDWNIATGEAYFNPRWFTMLDYEASELTASFNTWEALIHPEDKQIATEVLTRALSDPEIALCVELRCQESGGEWRVFEALAKQYRDSTGFVGVVINFRDITERLKIEEMHRELERERELSA